MLRRIVLLTISLMIAVIGCGDLAHVEAPYRNQRDFDRIEHINTSLKKFAAEYNNKKATTDILKVKNRDLGVALAAVVDSTPDKGLSDSYIESRNNFNRAVLALKKLTDTFPTVLDSKDATKMTAFSEELNTAIKNYNDAVDKLNKSVGVVDIERHSQHTPHVYVWALALGVVLAVVSWSWVLVCHIRRDHHKVTQRARLVVAWSSLWPFVGAIFVYAAFNLTEPEQRGGVFYIVYGPVFLGVVLLFQAILNYRKVQKASRSSAFLVQ